MKDTDILEEIKLALQSQDKSALGKAIADAALSILNSTDIADRTLLALIELSHDRRMLELGGSLDVLLLLQQELDDTVSPHAKSIILPRLKSLFKDIGAEDSTIQLIIAEILGSCYGNREALEALSELLDSAQAEQVGHLLTGFHRLCVGAKSRVLIQDALKVLETWAPRCPTNREQQLRLTMLDCSQKLS